MLSLVNRRVGAIVALAMIACAMIAAPAAFAQEEQAVEGPVMGYTVGDGIRVFGLALGAGIAIAGAGLGTARAQAAVGAGGTGAMAEKPELFTSVLILFAIPETIVVLGFVIAFFLFGAI
jgi:V/A-type H+-transporting ATPase subunit K